MQEAKTPTRLFPSQMFNSTTQTLNITRKMNATAIYQLRKTKRHFAASHLSTQRRPLSKYNLVSLMRTIPVSRTNACLRSMLNYLVLEEVPA